MMATLLIISALFLLMVVATPELLVGVSVAALMVADARYFDSATLSAVARLGALIGFALAALKAGRAAESTDKHLAHRFLGFPALILLLLLEIGVIHSEVNTWAIGLASFAIISLVMPRLVSLAHRPSSLGAVQMAMSLVMAASLGIGIIRPESGVVGARLVGLTSNANLLGFYAFLTIAVSILAGQRKFPTYFGVAASLVCLLWAGSRAGALATIIAIMGVIIHSKAGQRRRAMLLILLGMPALYMGRQILFGETGVLRTNDSRSGSLQTMLIALRSDSMWGVGLAGLPDIVASSPMRALAAGGLVGGIILLVAIAYLLRQARSLSSEGMVFAAAAVVHSIFEGWLVSLTGAMIILFIVLYVFLALREQDSRLAAITQSSPIAARVRA